MPRHQVSLEILQGIPIGNVDVEMPVKVDGKPLGRLLISKGHVEWLPSPRSRKRYRMTWARFAEVMASEGREVS